jgi:cell division protein FtsQ
MSERRGGAGRRGGEAGAGSARHTAMAGMAGLADDARVLPFRRRPFAARRKRPSFFTRLVAPFAGALMLVGSPAALAAWVLASPRFGLREVSLEGGQRVSKAWVVDTLEPLFGRNLVLLPLAEVEARIARHPWLEAVEASKEMPNRLRLVVVERRPAALLRIGTELRYLDGEGRPFAPCDPLDPEGSVVDLLLVSSSAGPRAEYSRALRLAGELAAAQPQWAAALSEVEMMGEEDFRIVTAALPFSLLVRTGSVDAGVHRLEPLLAEILRRYPERIDTVDLRFPQRVVLQPISKPRTELAAPPPVEAPGTGVRAGAPNGALPVAPARAA